jgi:hypothetical protein
MVHVDQASDLLISLALKSTDNTSSEADSTFNRSKSNQIAHHLPNLANVEVKMLVDQVPPSATSLPLEIL